MKKLNTKGFSPLHVLLLVVIVGLIGGVGYYVYNSQKKTNTALDNAAKSQSEPQKAEKKTNNTSPATKPQTEPSTNYLVIKEWGVKIPLSDVNKSATYKMGNGSASLVVNVSSDPNSSACNVQAGITRVANPSENSDNWRDRPSELQKFGSNVGGTYYFIEGSQSACTDNAKLQEQATAIRTAWVNQSKLIIAE